MTTIMLEYYDFNTKSKVSQPTRMIFDILEHETLHPDNFVSS